MSHLQGPRLGELSKQETKLNLLASRVAAWPGCMQIPERGSVVARASSRFARSICHAYLAAEFGEPGMQTLEFIRLSFICPTPTGKSTKDAADSSWEGRQKLNLNANTPKLGTQTADHDIPESLTTTAYSQKPLERQQGPLFAAPLCRCKSTTSPRSHKQATYRFPEWGIHGVFFALSTPELGPRKTF